MKQIIPFIKDINLNSKIFEITSIALEHNLKMENSDSIVGVFTVSGKYKINEVSINEEVFENNINFDITLDDKYDASKVKIDIDDFYYEIINDNLLRVHIDVLVDNLVYVKKIVPIVEEKIESEKVDLQNIISTMNLERNDEQEEKSEEEFNEKTELVKEFNDKKVEIKEINEENKEEEKNNEEIKAAVDSINSSFLADDNCYSTYKVHIIRDSETIDTIIEKYNTSKEELEKYNNLDSIMLGTKIIIPVTNE